MNQYPKTVEVPTDDGVAVATKSAQNEVWEIGYPWGDDRFFGTSAEVRSLMERRVAKQESESEAGDSDC